MGPSQFRIRYHTGMPNVPAARLMRQVQGNLRLGVKADLGWRLCDHLAMAHLAQGAQVLPRHPDRRLALLGEAGGVEPQEAIAFCVQWLQDFDPLAGQVNFISHHVGQYPLQCLFAGARRHRRQRAAILIQMFRQQPSQTPFRRFPALPAAKLELKRRQKLVRFRQRLFGGMGNTLGPGHTPYRKRLI